MPLNGLIRRSVLSTANPELGQRQRTRLQHHPSTLKRVVGVAIHDVVTAHPQPFARHFGIDIGVMRDGSCVGTGTNSIVFRDTDDTVVKVHHRTARQSIDAQERTAATMERHYKILCQFMSDFLVPQTSFVAAHPSVEAPSVVQTNQQFCDSTDPEIFWAAAGRVDHANLSQLRDSHPTANTQLAAFACASLALYDQRGVIPDLCGAGNLVVDSNDGRLVLVDTDLMTNDRKAHHVSLAMLQDLTAAL